MNAKTKMSDEWETPDWLFRYLDTEFKFTFDAAANKENTKCARWAGDIENEWRYIKPHDHVFCNPPYSNIRPFIEIALRLHAVWVFLLPANRSDTDWFHTLYADERVHIRWMTRRIRFLENGVQQKSPRFPSMIAIIK